VISGQEHAIETHSDSEIVTLFRPVGEKELELVRQSGWPRFPPRLPEQPIFYPALNEEYASQSASRWNARDGKIGYALRFQVEREYLDTYPIQTAGRRIHQEYRIPSEELEEFNRYIVGAIQILREFNSVIR
jgi:hypothetical protein